MRSQAFRLICVIALLGGLVGAGEVSARDDDHDGDDPESQDSEHDGSENKVSFDLAPSNADIARCLPHLKAHVEVDLRTARKGRDKFRIEASGFDVFDGPPKLSALTKIRIVGTGLLR